MFLWNETLFGLAQFRILKDFQDNQETPNLALLWHKRRTMDSPEKRVLISMRERNREEISYAKNRETLLLWESEKGKEPDKNTQENPAFWWSC